MDQPSFETRLQAVEDRIQAAVRRSGRRRSDVTLVAVSKKFSAERIQEAYRVGIREFGENYVQEFADKRPLLGEPKEAKFHLIGHLQSNKARQAAELFQVIETVDSVKLLNRLEAAAQENSIRLEILFEMKLSHEAAKTGAASENLPALLDAAASCKHLVPTGLMTIPPWSEDAEQSRPYFRQLALLARQSGLRQLSMGMSNDLEVAIEEGATIIRVGTALFGRRPKAEAAKNPSAT